MKATVLPATAKDPERIPTGFHGNPHVLVLLPSAKYVELMGGQPERSFEYHLLEHPGYKMLAPLEFDADAYVEEVLAYCRALPKVDAVMAFDCFPTMLASVINQELGLQGPSFRSVFVCCNKYYMRRELDPTMEIATPPEQPPQHFPAVLKIADTQFYVRCCPHMPCFCDGHSWSSYA